MCVTGALRRVWIDGWQMECCGEPFGVGSVVEWDVHSEDIDLEFLSLVLGQDEASAITDAEEHHDGPPRFDLRSLHGVVRSITAAFCEYRRAAPGTIQLDGGLPIAGTGSIEPRKWVDGSEPSRNDGEFVGYVVTLEADS